jgi:predicted DNA-binding transcriptional regulator YafY
MNNHPWEAGGDETVTAKVHFDESVAWWAGRTLGVEVERGSDLEVDVPLSNRDAFVGWVLSFGSSAEVLEPDDVRTEIRSRVEAALERSR